MANSYFRRRSKSSAVTVSVGRRNVNISECGGKYACRVYEGARSNKSFGFSEEVDSHLKEVLSLLKQNGVNVEVTAGECKVTGASGGKKNAKISPVHLRQLAALTALAKQLNSPHAPKIYSVFEAVQKFSAAEDRRQLARN